MHVEEKDKKTSRKDAPVLWCVASEPLRKQSAYEVRSLGIAAAWAHNMILNPPDSGALGRWARKCPFLSKQDSPLTRPHGLEFNRSDHSFHGFPTRSTNDSHVGSSVKKHCPYHST